MDFDPKTVPGLNIEAWQRWVAYRISIKKALKPMSLHAAAVKLAKYGEQQEEVVEQSVSNQWQGLFDLQVVKPMPGEKPKKTREQLAADAARDEFISKQAEKSAAAISADPMGELRMMDAVLSRLLMQQEDPGYAERYEQFVHRLGEKIAACDPVKVYADPHLRSLVLQVWSERGLMKLQRRAGIP